MIHHSVDDTIGKSIFFVQNRLDEDRVCAVVRKTQNLHQRRSGVNSGNGFFRDHRTHDLGFQHGGLILTERNQQTLEKRRGFVQSFLQRNVEMKVEFFVPVFEREISFRNAFESFDFKLYFLATRIRSE